MINPVARTLSQFFHLRHEVYSRLAYWLPGLPPDRFVFVLTNRCNLNCVMCYQSKKVHDNQLSGREWIDLSNQIPAMARVTLTGGEPLLFPGFRDVLENVARRHSCNVITNGTMLAPDIIDFMLSFKRLKVLAISLDGFEDATFRLRGVGSKQWAVLEKNIRYFVARKMALKSQCVLEIKTLILDETAGEMFNFHKYCMEDLKVDHHTFQFMKGSPLQHADATCSIDDVFKASNAKVYDSFDVIVKQLNLIRQYNVQTGYMAFMHPPVTSLVSSEPIADLSVLNSAVFRHGCFEACRFPWSSLHVNFNGDMFPCLAVPIGNVRELSLAEILGGASYREFLLAMRKNGLVQGCNRCGWLRVNRRVAKD